MRPQLLVFDLDGTLIDSRADLAEGVNHMRAGLGLDPLPLETVSDYIGDGVRKLVERSLKGVDCDFESALNTMRNYYASHLTVHTTLYGGVEEGLKRLVEEGHTLAILTNKPGEPSRSIIAHFGLTGYFHAVIGGDDTPGLKPDPDGIFRLLEQTGAQKSDAWMLGDHYADLAVAQNAGIRSAFLTYGFGEQGDCKPDAYFASFPELVGYFV